MVTKNKIVQYSLVIMAFFLIALFSTSSLLAATYYVTQSYAGGKTGIDCVNAKSLSWFNSNARAGDTAILCDGTYSTQIIPSNSGTFANRITYKADNQYKAVISTKSHGAYFLNKNYITIDGLYFNDCGSRWILMNSSDYNIIKNCKFYDVNAWYGIEIEDGSNYNKFLDNTFPDAPNAGNANGTSPADFIGLTGSPDNNYNVIEGNYFGNCYHDAIFIDKGERNVFRGNTVQNQYHTGLNLNDDNANLVEGNYFYDQGYDMENQPERTNSNMIRNPAIQHNGSYQIVRKNIFDNNGSGMMVYTYAGAKTEAHYARVYNNTVNRGVRPIWVDYSGASDYLISNIFKNNIFTNSEESIFPGDPAPDPYNIYYRDNNGVGNLFHNNASYGCDNHKFRNTYIKSFAEINEKYQSIFVSDNVSLDLKHTDAEINEKYASIFVSDNVSLDPKYTDADNRDFTLQSGSPMIDAGAWLTTITSSTASGVSSFTVADSRYFYDGWGIPDESGDMIMTQGAKGEQKKATKIIKIDYETNTITVSNPIDIKKDEGLSLIYFESAPDIGAHEYQGAIANPNPKKESDDSNEVDHTVTKPGGTSGKFQPGPDWCRDYGPCPEGQGDCDGDAECQSGLICAQDVGAAYGWPADRDVCERPAGTIDIFQPGPDWCRDYGPCPEGQGDCDGDAECQSGLICAQDVGAAYGWPADRDVCERPAGTIDIFQPGPDWCRDYGPCPEGQGDCDRDAECQSGLICAQDVGADYGWPADRDVCEKPAGTKDDAVAISSPTGFAIKSSQN